MLIFEPVHSFLTQYIIQSNPELIIVTDLIYEIYR